MRRDDYNYNMENEYAKQVIVIRKDLNMRKGKMCAQAAHASMKVLLDQMIFGDVSVSWPPAPYPHFIEMSMIIPKNSCLYEWLSGAFTKITVSVDSEEELLELKQKAEDAGMLCALITDAGKTEFRGEPTNTALAIGPAWASRLEPITGHLKLL